MTVLVAFASKHGATEEIAERVAEELRRCGIDVDLRPADAVREVEGYEAIVLGSAVYMGRWRPEARELLRRAARTLAERDLWLFSSGPVGKAAADPAKATPPGVAKVVARLRARDHMVFGGRVPDEPQGPVARAVVRKFPADQSRDSRDWEVIGRWARGIAAAVRTEVPA